MKDIVLITPPFTQLNTPYPATAYLKGFLNTKNSSSFQMDLGMEVILEIFSKKGLVSVFENAFKNNRINSSNTQRIYALKESYIHTIDAVILFLQGKNQTLARQICTERFLPQASRFDQLDDVEWAFGLMGLQDKAKHLATLYLEDVSDFIVACTDENFGFSRYAERLGMSANSFDELHESLQKKPTFVDQITLKILEKRLREHQPKMVGFSVPFPGNLYSAFRCAQYIKTNYPAVKIVMGGGFPNTELREISDVRVFDFFDYITLDDGELPLELLLNSVHTKEEEKILKRTFHLKNNQVFYNNLSKKTDYKLSETGTPDYSDLLLDKYISVIELTNPMHSLWSDGRWNKLTLAHGCYWGKCTFCDITLDYIKIYEPVAAKLLVDRMEQIIAQTGENGFHFVDEAAPPSLMKEVALEIIRRNLIVTWWTNIRFEKSFTYDLCQLLKASGCIAVSGGLEVASDRLLNLIQKGVSVAQVAQVTKNFTDSGILVHAYLMYGYPTQTVQETIDSLEMVRQLFETGSVQSGFWHQFALTTHSPIGKNPSAYGIIPNYQKISFANNDIQFTDTTGVDHSKFSFGLKKSLYNFMHGIGFDIPLHDWFDFKIPKTSIPKDYIANSIVNDEKNTVKPTSKIYWLGTKPLITTFSKSKKGKNYAMTLLTFHQKNTSIEIKLEKEKGLWLADLLLQSAVSNKPLKTVTEVKSDFELQFEHFELFWQSKPVQHLRENGLLLL